MENGTLKAEAAYEISIEWWDEDRDKERTRWYNGAEYIEVEHPSDSYGYGISGNIFENKEDFIEYCTSNNIESSENIITFFNKYPYGIVDFG